MKHAKRSGWRPFWAALCAALLVLLPLVGGTVLLSRAQLRSSLRQAAKSQSGVPIRLPKAADRCTVLLCVADETPGFVLAYLNAGQNCIHLLAVPAALEVPFGGKNVPLADCYAAAGPARCREALSEVFALPEDTDYLAIAPAVLTKLAARYGAVRVGFTGALTPEQLARYGKGTGVQGISAADAHSFLAALDADTSLSPRRSAAARAAVWDAFFRQALELLPTTLPQGLREVSSSLLTSLTAVDLATLERTLEFLATSAEPVDITADALPGDWAGGHYTVSDASRAAVQSFFNLSRRRSLRPAVSHNPAPASRRQSAPCRSGRSRSAGNSAPHTAGQQPAGRRPAAGLSAAPAGAGRCAAPQGSALPVQRKHAAPPPAHPGGLCRRCAPALSAG